MADSKEHRTNPFTGTVVMEPASVKKPAASKSSPRVAPPPAAGEPAAQPLNPGAIIAALGVKPVAADPDSPPPTQAIPMRLNGPAVPFASTDTTRPDSERTSHLPPWAEVQSHVKPAAHALSGTLVEHPAPPKSQLVPHITPAPAGIVDLPPPSVEPPSNRAPLAPPPPPSQPQSKPEDIWGSKIREVAPAELAPLPAAPEPPPAPKLPERAEVRKSLYGRFFKGK